MKATSALTIFGAGIAAAVIAPHFYHSAPSFLAGASFPAIAIVAALSSRKRLRQAAKALNAIAAIGTEEQAAPARRVEPVAPVALESPLQSEVASALLNLGTKRSTATKAAAQAIAAMPGAEFLPTFTAAVRLLQN